MSRGGESVRRYGHQTDRNQSRIVKALRECGVRVHVCSAFGGGFPDLLCWRPAVGYRLLEIKDGSLPPSRRTLTGAEQDFAGVFPVAVVLSVEDAMRAVGLGRAA